MSESKRDQEFRAFYLAEAERLRRLALFLTADRNQAEDLAQEALVRTYKAWARIREGDPGPYARRILVNLVRSAHRRKVVALRHARGRSDGAVEGPDRAVADWLHVARALSELPPVRRAAIVMRYYEDLPERDIAEALDRPLNTAKSDIRRGLEALRPLLAERERRWA